MGNENTDLFHLFLVIDSELENKTEPAVLN